MHAKGIKVGVSIYQTSEPEKLFKVIELHNNLMDLVCIQYMKGEVVQETDENKITFSRLAVLSKYVIYKEIKVQFCTTHPDPSDNIDLNSSTLQGVIKHMLIIEFHKSQEQHCVLQVAPTLKVFATKTFSKAGSLKLTPITNQVIMSKTLEKAGNNHYLGKFGDYNIFLKNGNVLPSKASEPNPSSLFVSKFFCVRSSHDQTIVNCELTTKDVEVSVGTHKYQLAVPMITNTKHIANEVELVCLSNSTEPIQKKPRLSDDSVAPAASKGKGKSKSSKGKGKAKAKSKK